MRIIARLDIKNEKLIKGVMMEGVRVLGNASEYATKYQRMGISEIFYVDNVASLYGRNNLVPLIKEHVKNCRIPVTVGGGISTIDDVYKLMKVGADKIAINTNALINPEIIRNIANIFGSQAVSVSIQVIKVGDNYELRSHGGREKCNIDLFKWIKEVQKLGCGEIFITAIHRDGTLKGPDLKLLEKTKSLCRVPLIYSGGISKIDQIFYLKEKNLCDGVAVGKAFHLEKIEFEKLNPILISKEINLNENNLSNKDSLKINKKINISVLNTNFGNIGSLVNLLDDLDLNYKIYDSYTKELEKSEFIILPGVGSYPTAMNFLKESNLDQYLKESAFLKKPIMGICLGMQLLFDSSEEIGYTKGLGFIKGEVVKLNADKEDLRLNIGWRKIYSHGDKLTSVGYFIHSFGVLNNCNFEDILTSNFINKKFIAEVKNKNICGFQYHPEKSSEYGKKRFLYRFKQLSDFI